MYANDGEKILASTMDCYSNCWQINTIYNTSQWKSPINCKKKTVFYSISMSLCSPFHTRFLTLTHISSNINSLHWQLYIQHVTTDQQSKASSNLYFDVTVQISIDKFKVVWVMHQRGEGSKRQLFVDKLHNQPVKLYIKPSVSIFQSNILQQMHINWNHSIPQIKVNLRFSLKQAWEVTKIDTPDIKCFLSQNQNKHLTLLPFTYSSNNRKLG